MLFLTSFDTLTKKSKDELAAIAAFLASLEAMRLNDTEENYLD